MPATVPSSRHPRLVLSLIVLIANVAAPIYTHNGRTLLEAGNRAIATRSMARVRVVAPAGTIEGFRAPVGLAKGGTEAHRDLDRPAVLRSLPSSVRGFSPSSALNQGAGRPHPPLRC
jgi:hypothetical protein